MIQLYWGAVTSLIKLNTTRDGRPRSGSGILGQGGHEAGFVRTLEDMLIQSKLYERIYSGQPREDDPLSRMVVSREMYEGSYNRSNFIIGIDSLRISLKGEQDPVDAVHAYGGLFKDKEIAIPEAAQFGREASLILRDAKRAYNTLLLSDGTLALRYENSVRKSETESSFSLIYSHKAQEGVLPYRSSIREIRDDVEAARKKLKLPPDRKVFPDMISVAWMMTQAIGKVTPGLKANYVGSPGSEQYNRKH